MLASRRILSRSILQVFVVNGSPRGFTNNNQFNNYLIAVNSLMTTIRTMTMKVTALQLCADLKKADGFDGLVVVAPEVMDAPQEVQPTLKTMVEVDEKAESGVFLCPWPLSPMKRVIFSSTGKLDKDTDDVRCFAEAAEKGIARAIKAGCKAPLLFCSPRFASKLPKYAEASILGALKAAYVPLEMREARPEKAEKVKKIGVVGNENITEDTLNLITALETGKVVCRDIGGSDPERMAAPRVEDYVMEVFKDTNIKVDVVKGQATFETEYPCLAAVNRAASLVPRHDGRVIWLTYEPEGPVDKTLIMVGKGITYDSGGADIKTGGNMAGMSRDKCGAASVAGIVKAISMIKPPRIKVIGVLGMIRNSVGENCYVSDEIITSRAGVRLRVGNTDAEGRMVMADLLCHAKEKALEEGDPQLMTLATLTGHAKSCYGLSYSAIMDNGPSAKAGFARSLQDTGDLYGDLFEVSTIRREDFEVNKDKCGEFVEVLQVPESKGGTPRGHQLAAGFLQLASGLDKHMLSSGKPLKYSHLDMAGSSGKLPEPTTAASVVAIVMNAMK